MFEYFYGNETEQYLFFSVPQLLFTDNIFKNLSCESKLLYSFLLDRTGLSQKNNWHDEDGKVYVYFKQDELCERLNIGKDKAIKVFNELDFEKGGIGLIERKKQGQGRPTKIYVKNFAKFIPENSGEILTSENQKSEKFHAEILTSENQKSEKFHAEVLTSEKPKSEDFIVEVRNKTEVLTSENQKSKPLDCRSLKVGKSEVLPINHTNISILSESYLSNLSETDCKPKSEPTSESFSPDMIDKIDFNKTLAEVKKQIEFEYLINDYDEAQLNEITELIAWCICTPAKSLKINGTNIDTELVRSKCCQLDEEHIRYIMDCLQANTTEIKNRRNYLLTCIYNAPTTMDGYYAAKVQHDLYGN